MGIFGDDKLQDQRIAALERHVRALTETMQANQADLAAGWIAILALQAQVDEKVSSADVDPALGDLNQQLAAARKQLEESSAAEVAAGDEGLETFAAKLKKDTSALILVSDPQRADEFVNVFRPYNGEVIETNLNEHDIKALKEALKAERKR